MDKLMNKVNVLGAVVQGGTLGYKRRPDLFVGDEKQGYIKGDLMDANAVSQLVSDAINEGGQGDTSTIEEINEQIVDINTRLIRLSSGSGSESADDTKSIRAIAAEEAAKVELEVYNKSEVDTQTQTIVNLINQKQMEVGAVPNDITPTEGSSNWVTSGGINDLYREKNTIFDITVTSGWKNGNTVSLLSGQTYHVVITNSDTNVLTYFKVHDTDDNQSQPLAIPGNKITGIFETDYIPETDVTSVDFYAQKASQFVITQVNNKKILLTKDDIVNDAENGGEKKVLSAERGKQLGDSIRIINQFSLPLSHGHINTQRYGQESLVYATACFENSGFKSLKIRDGYEYVLYASDSAVYGTGTTTTIIGTYTSELYVNNSNLAYFWIDVKRIDGEEISPDELFDIVLLESDNSEYNFGSINNVRDYYKYANEISLTDIEYINGEGVGINGITTNDSHSRTKNIDVSKFDAIKAYVNSSYDTIQFSKKVRCAWFNVNNELVGISDICITTQDNYVIIGVPKNAKYVSIDAKGNSGWYKLSVLKHEVSASDAHYYTNKLNCIGNLKDVSLIICSGQSLMVGADAPGISYKESYYPLRMIGYVSSNAVNFSPLVNAQGSLGYEKPDRGIGEMFVESIERENGVSAYANEWERHLIVFANLAVGGKTIAELTDDSLFSRVADTISNTKTLCDKFGLEMDAPIWVWMQGEQDIKEAMSSADYKEALLAYQNKICNTLSTIAGITKRPKCVIYQPASQCLYSQVYNYSNPYLEFLNAYVELLRDNDEFLASTPAYIFDGADNVGGFVHLNPRSYKTLGAYSGYTIKKYLIDNIAVKGVIPIDISVDNTTIKIKYNVPCPPLRIDTEWVKETPLVNGVHTYGYNVVKNDDTELISSVSVFDDTVTIECIESPIGAKLRYGLNGDRIHMSGSNYWGIDGRIYGGRGNIRDSQGDYVQKEIRELGQTMRLDNWAYCFEKLLEE